jgi:hypothetical protein
MKITIAQRLRPYSHRPKTTCLIPYTQWSATIYPTRLIFSHIEELVEKEFSLPVKGPVEGFTVLSDLEKGRIAVFGKAKEGFFRYYIYREQDEIVVECDKAPEPFALLRFAIKDPLKTKEPLERLSLGAHRALDWELVTRRLDLREILPVLFHLSQVSGRGQQLPAHSGIFTLLQQCLAEIKARQKESVGPSFLTIFRAAFYGIATPRIQDEEFQGIITEPSEGSPLAVLHTAAEAIRSLFFTERDQGFELLSCLPVELHSGRLIGITTQAGDQIDLEWSKKLLRRVIIKPVKTREVCLFLQKQIGSFRLRRRISEKGERHSCDQPIALTSAETLYLDRFEK